MRYQNVERGRFIARPNRFIAHVVHIDEQPPFFYGNQVIGCFPAGIRRPLQVHRRPGNQQFPAPAGIFHMADPWRRAVRSVFLTRLPSGA